MVSVLRPISSLFRSRGTLCLSRLSSRNYSAVVEDDDFKLHKLEGEQEGIAVFSMRRHAGKNSFSRNMVNQMRAAMDIVKFDKNVRVVIIRSEVPGVFCAGADLKERAKMKPEEVGPFVAKLRGMVSELSDLPMPVIAAIDGAAVGGGLEMALGCDLRTAADTSKLGLVETKLAIIPGAGGTQRLPRLVGPAIAQELIFTSRIILGEEAARIGLVNHCAKQNEGGDAAYQRALEIAEEIIPQGPVALRMAKMAVNKGIEVDLQSGLAVEQACYAQLIPTKDRVEGLTAFREKRKPVYKGE